MALTKITTSVIAANTLETANIADNSIDATKIASNSILTRHIDDDQITGDQLADNITIAGNLTVSGNLVTNGASVTNSSTNTTIEDNLIELGTGTTGSPSSDSGIVIERGDSDNAFIGWDESEDKFILGTGSFTGASTGNLTITTAPLVVGALTTSGLSFPTSDGTNGQVLKTDGSGSLTFGDNTTKVDNYTATGDGSTTAFDTGINPGSEVNTWIFIDGVYQQKSEYSYSGSTVTFTTAPQNGASIDVITGTSSNITASDTVLGVYEATTTNTDTYATGISASNENNTWVFVGGVYQPKDSYTFSSGTLTFDANTPTGQKLSVVATKTITAGAVDTSTLAANAVTSAKIASNSILSRHIANNSIVGADISATTQITASTFTGALTGNVTGNVVGNLTGTIQTAAQTNITSVGTLSALTVDDITIDGSTISDASDFTLDIGGDIILDADGGDVILNDAGTEFGRFSQVTSDFVIKSATSDKDIVFKGNDGGSTITALTLDMSDAGTAIFNHDVKLGINHKVLANTINDSSNGYNLLKRISTYTQVGDNSNGLVVKDSGGAGTVGIGTNSPEKILHIKTSVNNTAFVRIESTATDSYPTLSLKNDAREYQLTTHGGVSDSFVIYDGTAGANRLVINTSGNVGIGTASPSYRLHTSGSDIIQAWFQSTHADTCQIQLSTATTNSYARITNNAGTLLYESDVTADNANSGHQFKVDGSERMRIDASGNVGIGVASGGDKLHVLGTGLFQDSRGGSLAGVQIHGGSGSEYPHITVTQNNPLTFKTYGLERIRIHSGGDFTVATTTVIGSMYNGISGIGFGYSSGGYGACVRGGTNTPFYVSTNSQGAGGFIEFAQNGATRGNITYTGSATSYNASSDYRLKENAVPIQNALSKIDLLNPINFDWIESGDNSDGFLAHEIQAVLPYTVTGTKDEVYTDENSGEEKLNGEPKYQVMDYAKLTPLLVKAIQEQQIIIDDLKSRIETLEE